MPLVLPKDAKPKPTGGTFLKKEGYYKVTIVSQKDQEDTSEKSKRYKWKLHNLRLKLENGKSLFTRVYYQNDEGDIDPSGYNFILALKKVLQEAKDNEAFTKKLENADSNKIIDKLIKDKIEFYIETKNSTYNGTERTNVNTFSDPIFSLRDAEEAAKKSKLSVINLLEEKEEKKKETNDEDFDDDDDFEETDDDDFDDDDDL